MCESRLPVGSSAKSTVGRESERARDGDPLLLAARELGGPMRAPVGEAGRLEQLLDPGARRASRRRSTSGRSTFSSAVSIGSRLKNWKTKPMWRRRSFVSSLSFERRDLDPVDLDRALGAAVEAGEDVHQGRLAGARRAHDGGEMAARDLERDAAEGVDGGVAGAVAAREVGALATTRPRGGRVVDGRDVERLRSSVGCPFRGVRSTSSGAQALLTSAAAPIVPRPRGAILGSSGGRRRFARAWATVRRVSRFLALSRFALPGLAAALLVGTVVEFLLLDDLRHRGALVALAAVAGVALLLQPYWPLAAPVVAVAAIALTAAIDPAGIEEAATPFFVILLAAWCFGAYNPPRRALVGLVAIIAATVFVVLRVPDELRQRHRLDRLVRRRRLARGLRRPPSGAADRAAARAARHSFARRATQLPRRRWRRSGRGSRANCTTSSPITSR